MIWQRPGRRALVATLTVVASLLPLFLIVAVSALGDAPEGGGNSGAGPAIVGFSPRQGTISGGTVVHISGGGFTDVTGVSFGGHPARSFQVRSDNVIDAVTPSVARGVSLRIGIAASGGTSISHATFDFLGCHVPRLKGELERRARKTLVAAGCKVGQVQREPGAREPLRVIGESPHPGTWLEPGTPVALRVR
jgi:IPT/TIG domain